MRALEKANITNFSFHNLRHTFCTRAGMAGLSTQQIKQISGHKTDVLVNRYTHLGLQQAKESMKKLDEFLGEVNNNNKVAKLEKVSNEI